MTRADSGTKPLRRSRTAPMVGAAHPRLPAPIIPKRRVELRLWGLTPTDLAFAEGAAFSSVGADWWDVVEIVATYGGRCPIPMRDRLTLGQGADYGRAWAAYPAAVAAP